MDKERLKQIFIEEANEIIEKLDVEIINFEEDPANKDILNELFRGVHTLKGSANSFGFTRLGGFVHHFEDALDYYRSADEIPSSETIDLFLTGVDVIKEVLELEVGGSDGVPDQYEACLAGIQKVLDGGGAAAPEPAPEPMKDLSEEFGDLDEAAPAQAGENPLPARLEDGERLAEINLTFDDDIFFRGYDHITFFKLFEESGRVLEARWDLSAVPPLGELEPNKNYIKSVKIYLATMKEMAELEEHFEFVEENEYAIRFVEGAAPAAAPAPEPEPEAEPVPSAPAPEPAPAPSPAPAQNIRKEEPKGQEASPAQHKTEKKASFVKIDTAKLDELFDSVGELVIAQNFLAENGAIRDLEDENVAKTIETLSKITRLIQNRVMSLRMVPIKDTFDKMKRVVRDASKKVNKEVKLHVVGEDTEIDKTMIDALSDPLIHIIRNAIDHGLEATAEDRTGNGKAAEGNVTLRAFHRGGNIAIEVMDDGRGINREKVLAKAIERGVAREDEEYTDSQVYAFLMQAGFSTAEKITDISGRGVGLDVVRNFIESMRGKIEVESELGKGSKFTILLPLTLAIIDGMLVKSSGETFIIPTLSIVESFRPDQEIVHTAQGKGEFVNLREELLPIVRLNRILGLNDETPPPWEGTLVCAENEKGRFTILVDELVGRQQVVIKTLGRALSKLKEISGGAVLGNGEVALILNVEGLYRDEE